MKDIAEKRVVNEMVRFYNTENYYETGFANIQYSEGMKNIIERWKCMWLIDIITAYQYFPRFKSESFQTWKLERMENERFLITAENGKGKKLCMHNIPFSDFEADELTVWKIEKRILLPTER